MIKIMINAVSKINWKNFKKVRNVIRKIRSVKDFKWKKKSYLRLISSS